MATAGLLSILGLPLEVQGYWTKEGDLGVPDSVSDIPAGGPPLDDPAAGAWDADSSQASATEPEEPVCKQAKVLDREARYVIVELPGAVFRLHKAGASGCWMGRKRAFRNSRDYTARPKAHEYTHVCKLSCAGRPGRGTPRTMIRLRAR